MPLFTSFHLTSALRKALASARHVPRTAKVQPKASFRAKAQAYIRSALRETFPTITHDITHGSRQAAHAYALQPIRLGSRNFSPQSARARLHTASQTFRSSYALPHAARAGRGTANVGIGTARGFASGAGGGQAYGQVQQHVPMGLRAFAALLSDEEHEKALPRASRVHPYSPLSRQKRQRIRSTRHRQSICTIDSRVSATATATTAASALGHYFPARPSSTVELPVAIESLVTPSACTILSLPLSPSLSALLDPTPRVPYADASVGVAVLSTLTSGVLSLQEAFGIHFADRILPLLAHIDALGVLQMEPKVEYEAVCDIMGQPDILRLTFHGRSEGDVRRLLQGRLADGADGWFNLRQESEQAMQRTTTQAAVKKVQEWTLNKVEAKEMMEDWASVNAHCRLPVDEAASQLVMPVLDISAPSDWSAMHSPIARPISPMPEEAASPDWPISSFSSPISGIDYSSINSASTSGFSSPVYSSSSSGSRASSVNLNASLLSQLSGMQDDRASTSWHSPPSEADSDVESAVSVAASVASVEVIDALREVWDMDVQEEQEARLQASDGQDGVEVDVGQMGWTGSLYVWSGDGFGLAQPW